jgi:hypothetical protein
MVACISPPRAGTFNLRGNGAGCRRARAGTGGPVRSHAGPPPNSAPHCLCSLGHSARESPLARAEAISEPFESSWVAES